MRWRQVVGALVVAGVAAIVIVAVAGGGSDKQSPTATTKAPPATTQPHAQKKKKAQKKPKTRHRQGVRRGHGKTPDEPAPGTGPLLGIADQKASTFADPLFRQIGVARSRLNTPWNAVFTEPARLDEWLQAARADGVEPLIAFERARGSQCPAAPCALPSVAAYTRAVTAFHQKYPWVHLLQAWNEANSGTQPTGTNPERAAAYYDALRRVCPGCIITAADVLDSGNLDSWLARFKAALHGRPAPLWGLHNYTDSNRFGSAGTRRMLAAVNGEIWFTEAGGIVSFKTADGRTALPYDEQRAARSIRFLFSLARLSRRITRIYVYQWKIDFPGNRFDAGLVGPDGKPRPSLQALLQHRSLLR